MRDTQGATQYMHVLSETRDGLAINTAETNHDTVTEWSANIVPVRSNTGSNKFKRAGIAQRLQAFKRRKTPQIYVIA